MFFLIYTSGNGLKGGPRLSLSNIRSWNENLNSLVQRLFESIVLYSWST